VTTVAHEDDNETNDSPAPLLLPVLATLAPLAHSSGARAPDQGQPQSQETVDKVVQLNREGVGLGSAVSKQLGAPRFSFSFSFNVDISAGVAFHP
jgi:hypothetical protein